MSSSTSSPENEAGKEEEEPNAKKGMGGRELFYGLLAFRIYNAICNRTFFQPDEYFQSLEPAWDLIFAKESGAWLTWEWTHHLRSSLHPVLFAAVYYIANDYTRRLPMASPTKAMVLIAAPSACQAVFAALGDYFTLRLAERVFGRRSRVAWGALWMSIINPWQWYVSTRTFSNSIEMTLTVMALSFWPWALLEDAAVADGEKAIETGGFVRRLRWSLISAAFAVVLRPTNLLIWLAVLTITLTRFTLDGTSLLSVKRFSVICREIVLCGSVTLTVSALCDRLYFGEWTLPQWQWLLFNVHKDLAVFYGRNDWHYYLTQGVPLLTTTLLPFTALGLYEATTPAGSSILQSNTLRVLAFAVLATTASMSVVVHKEFRFIYPLLPILHVLGAPSFTAFFTALPPVPAQQQQPPSPPPKPTTTTTTVTPAFKLRRKRLLAALVLANALVGGYLSLLHQRAHIDVVHFLRREYERVHPARLQLYDDYRTPHEPPPRLPDDDAADELFALFLTPCHTTPWRSHLVYPRLRARALACEPPLHTAPRSAERENYRDETDVFHDDGAAYLRRLWIGREEGEEGEEAPFVPEDLPRYIVGFEGIEPVLDDFFAGPEGAALGVRLGRVWAGWNGLMNEDKYRQGYLVVWDTGLYPLEPRE